MNEALDEVYLIWLYSQVASVKSKSKRRSYWRLMRQLFRTEFVWFVPNDDNRVEDGRDMRYEFLVESEIEDVTEDWIDIGCSMLEMLIALSRRLSFQAEGPPEVWFWHLLENLDLHLLNDAEEDFSNLVAETLDRVIFRQYSSDGRGGLFPLRRAERDQTKIEIWHQMCAYVLEVN